MRHEEKYCIWSGSSIGGCPLEEASEQERIPSIIGSIVWCCPTSRVFPGCQGGMFDHNTIRVLTSFRSVSLTFDCFFRQATSDSSKGAIVMIIHSIALSIIIKRILFLLVVLLTLFQVTGDNLEKAIVKIAEGNILYET
jgi:hypothetical protein